MRYYLSVYTLQPANSLQRMLVEEAQEWHGCLIESDAARSACYEKMSACVGRCNRERPKCKPCSIERSENGFSIRVANDYDSDFAMFTFNKIRNVYTGGETMDNE